jgi:hypothetical protein
LLHLFVIGIISNTIFHLQITVILLLNVPYDHLSQDGVPYLFAVRNLMKTMIAGISKNGQHRTITFSFGHGVNGLDSADVIDYCLLVVA